MLKTRFGTILIAVILASSGAAQLAQADQTITCKSHDHQYHHCNIDTHGYVTLTREHSNNKCRQGSSWDYDKRGIWVDNNCKADFLVESRHHTNGHSDHSGEKAVAAVAAVALIAAAASAANKHDQHDRYRDEEYQRGGHSSYIPGWMQGTFKGYNMQYGADVTMKIGKRGRVKANVEGTELTGYINDDRLYIGNAEFYIDRAGDGFNTVQVNDRSNKVHYHPQ